MDTPVRLQRYKLAPRFLRFKSNNSRGKLGLCVPAQAL